MATNAPPPRQTSVAYNILFFPVLLPLNIYAVNSYFASQEKRESSTQA